MTALDLDPSPLSVTSETVASATAGLPIDVKLVLRAAASIRHGELTIGLPDGRSLLFRGPEPGPRARLDVSDLGFARRILKDGDLGVAEGFLRGEWTSPDLTSMMEVFCVNADHTNAYLAGKPLYRAIENVRRWLRRNTRAGSRRNIEAHYDLGNAFYEQWLDPSMTYSSALYTQEALSLEAAQARKYEALAKASGVTAGERVLEIGCGWGGFAEYAAREIGAHVTGLTISPSQLDYARRRVFEAGLADRVTLKLQDYRDERGTYDRIVSIEMFEAVGEKWWPAFFGQLRDRLRPGGTAGLQLIAIQDRFFASYRRETDFIQRYIFPGGMLPSPGALKRLADGAGMRPAGERVFGRDYATTLAAWRERFHAAWPSIQPLGFDERFRRLWEYYLAYCEAGFRSGNIDVRQVVFAKP